MPDDPSSSVLVTTTPTGITTITLSRPAVRNAVDAPTAAKLYAAFLAFEADSTQKICVFTGAGGTFCAGFDLHTVSSLSPSPHTSPNGRNIAPMGPSRLIISKPVIAAVSGYAVAGGLELSLLADIRIVEEDAVFGVFCRRWGVPLIDGGTVRLPAIVGLGRAMDMILTGRPVGAQEAQQMGLANRVVPKGRAVEEAVKMAEELLKFPQACMNVDRASAYNAVFGAGGWEDKMRAEYDGGVKVLRTESVVGAERFSKGAGRHGDFSKL
jgi:enoyl-CoA hydratase/carnithine racemase